MDKNKRNVIIVAVIAVLLFASVSALSFTSIAQLQGNARVVNYAGIVRGGTQRLVKEELMGYPNTTLEAELTNILHELQTGEGSYNLEVLQDYDYQSLLREVQTQWDAIREQIAAVRAGGDSQTLFDLSEEYFILVDRTVSAAESYSEGVVNRSTLLLIIVNAVGAALLVTVLVYFVRSLALRLRAEQLGKIAYVDTLTKIPNRASCEQEIQRLREHPPTGDTAVFMFDMNNLKEVNDRFGHQGGDRIITAFGTIIKEEGARYGFVGRYGGDEFLAIFPGANEATVLDYLGTVGARIEQYNDKQDENMAKLSFAVGYIIESPYNMQIEDMIDEADKRMYINKRQMKEVPDLADALN